MARILVVNDETELLEMCKLVLEFKGHEVRTCASLEGLRELMLDFQPEVIVLDWYVGSSTAGEVLPMVRSELPDSPVLIMTGTEGLEEKVRRLGAAALLGKPFSVATFTNEVARLVQNCPCRLSSEECSEQGCGSSDTDA